MSLSSAFIATVALLIIVVVVGRPDSTVLGRMANPLAVTALGWTRTFMIVITLGTQRFRPGVWFPVTIACGEHPGTQSKLVAEIVDYRPPHHHLFLQCCLRHKHEPMLQSSVLNMALFHHVKHRLVDAIIPGSVVVPPGSVVVQPGSVVVPPGSVVVPPGSVVVTTGSVVVPPGSVVVPPGSVVVTTGSVLVYFLILSETRNSTEMGEKALASDLMQLYALALDDGASVEEVGIFLPALILHVPDVNSGPLLELPSTLTNGIRLPLQRFNLHDL
ncbi:hypothetical protein Tco_0122223 [Tanacetum coccineum]